MSKYTSFPLDETWYTAEAEQLYNSNRTNGVFSSNDEFLTTFKSGMTITVSPGRAWLHIAKFKGFVFGSFENVDLTLDIGDGLLNRIDRILIRYDVANNTTSLKVLKGAPAQNPTPPPIVREPLSYYDLCIAEVRIDAGTIVLNQGMISDKRLDENLCGVVKDGIESIPTQALQQQWESWFSNLSTKSEADIQNWYNTNTTLFGNQFNAWFATLKNTLDSNQAGNLFNLIDANKNKITAIETNTTNANYSTKTITSNSIFLPDAIGGFAKLTLEGNTRYKKADGTYVDVWEQNATLESVGEASGLDILSRGKNLVKNGNGEYGINSWNEKINNTAILKNDSANGFLLSTQFAFRGYLQNVNVKPNTSYTASGEFNGSKIQIVIRKTDSSLIAETSGAKKISFNTGSETIIQILVESRFNSTTNEPFSNIQLEEGLVVTSYESYKESKISNTTQLRKIPNISKDVYINGNIVREIGIRPYQSGDENNQSYMTDRITTLYTLSKPISEEVAPLSLEIFKNGNLMLIGGVLPNSSITYATNLKGQIDSNSGKCNQLFQFANNGKKNWVDVIGTPLATTDTFEQLKIKTQTLKNTLAINLINKGQNSIGTEPLNDLINKILSISTGKNYATGNFSGKTETVNLGFVPHFIVYYFNAAPYTRAYYWTDLIKNYYLNKVFIETTGNSQNIVTVGEYLTINGTNLTMNPSGADSLSRTTWFAYD